MEFKYKDGMLYVKTKVGCWKLVYAKGMEQVVEKVQLWKRYSSRVCKMYVISGYDSQDEKDIEGVFFRIIF